MKAHTLNKALWATAVALSATSYATAQSVVYRENFTYNATTDIADAGWTAVWDGPFLGNTHTGFGAATLDDGPGAGVSVAGAASVASSPSIADDDIGFVYLDMVYKNPPNDIVRSVLLSTTEVAALNLNSSNITAIGFHGHDYGYGNETWAEPFTGRAALQIGGTWYVSNTPYTANATTVFQSFSFDLSGTWGTITDTSVALSFSGTGSLAVGVIQAAGVLVTQPTDAYLAFDQFSITAVPEPSAFAALAGLGALGFVATRRRRAA